MSTLQALVLDHILPPSHARVVASNISGSISLACWIFLLLPQLLEQWRLKSADGISIGFITAWMIGDIANFLGAVLAHLRPNVILLALWFCFSDALLMLSYMYYKRQSRLKELLKRRRPSQGANQSTPLLREDYDETDSMATTEQLSSGWLLSTGLPLVFVVVVATLSYAVSDSTPDEGGSQPEQNWLVESLGYFSAVMYLCARIPQILQNHRRRSVDGLSMGFFLLSTLGNLTYAGQIIIYRSDESWVWAYMPWLLGSLGTILEDSIIFAQFFLYRSV